MSRPILNSDRSEMDQSAPLARPCDHPGCRSAGEYRAPRSREDLRNYYWFCLDHVRSYNASWNYYAGMNEAQIEAELRKDMVGQRPSWKFGDRVAWRFGNGVRDFGLFDFEEAPRSKPRARPATPQELALETFDLTLPLTLAALKARYKQLVKLHHPDAHGGDKAAEERLKIINRAYATLKASYFPS
jgi:DnaJ domain